MEFISFIHGPTSTDLKVAYYFTFFMTLLMRFRLKFLFFFIELYIQEFQIVHDVMSIIISKIVMEISLPLLSLLNTSTKLSFSKELWFVNEWNKVVWINEWMDDSIHFNTMIIPWLQSDNSYSDLTNDWPHTFTYHSQLVWESPALCK